MFNIKQYEKDNSTLIQSIDLAELISVGTYGAEINGGFDKIGIKFAFSVSNNDFEIGDIVHLQFKENILFIGSIFDVKKLYGKSEQTLELQIIGLSGLTGTLITNASYSAIASDIIKDLVDDFNTDYGHTILTYDASSIPTTTGTLDIDFSSFKSYLTAMRDVAETSGLYLFIDNDGKVYFKEKSGFTTHTLKAGKEVDSITINEDGTDLINSLILKNAVTTKTYNDATSQTTYGKKEKYIDKSSELSNEATADVFGASYIAKNKDKVKKISITVNNEYNFFNITPGDLLNIRNILYTIDNLQVVKIKYGLETCQIELETFYSFSKEIFNS